MLGIRFAKFEPNASVLMDRFCILKFISQEKGVLSWDKSYKFCEVASGSRYTKIKEAGIHQIHKEYLGMLKRK